MKLKNILIALMALMCLTSSLFTLALNEPILTEETKLTHEQKISQAMQKNSKDSILDQKEKSSTPHFSSTKTEENLAKSQIPNIFPFDSFVKDISTHKTDMWLDLAKVDEDSVELVIGINNAQPDSYAKISDLIVKNGGKLVNTVSAKGEVIAVVADLPLDSVHSFTEDVQASNLARYIEPNMKYQTQLEPNDPHWWQQWGPVKIEADYAWNTAIGDPSVLVAAIDTGIDYNHPDLDANYVVLGYDWVNSDNDPIDDNGHGTHCAGIIAAELNNGIGIAGLAQVSIMAEKGLDQYGSGWEDDLANALIHAVNQGADILSNSWGGYGESMLIHDAVKYAHDSDVLIVAAAGNDATRNKLYPAAYDEVIAVTATDRYDDPAWFTNFGEWVEVAAPGVDIYSTMPTYHVTLNDPPYNKNLNYDYLDGTSMATPHVSGVTALIWSQFPNVTRDWVRAQLRFTADDLGDPGFDDYYGYGRINARKAVEEAPPNHDLLIFDWEKPKYVQPGDLVTFNTTLLNFGANDESNITVQLLVDGNIVDSASIGFLESGTSATVSSLWNATFEGIYNVTAWVVPVPGENNTANNAIQAFINVQFIEIALFKNFDPWGYPANEEVLSLNGIPYSVFNSKDFGRVNLTSFSKVIIASDQDYSFYYDMDTYRWWFEDYVSSGGMLEIHAADWGWNGGRWVGTLPGGLLWNSYYAQYVTIIDPTHPVVNIPNPITDPELDNWNYAVHGYFISYPANSRIVITEDSSGYPAYLEFDYGAGVIVASSQTLEWAYTHGFSLILENSLLYTAVKYPHELAVYLEAPAFLEPNHSSLLNATVYNIGLNNETDVELQLLIEGSIVNSTLISELVNGSSYTLGYLWTPLTEATYNVTAYAPPVPEEEFEYNNKVTRFVTVTYPLIRPIEGQWANYIMYYYDATGRIIGTGYWNFTYDYYVEPYMIYVTVWMKDPSGYIGTYWMIVNIMNRWVESGMWAGLWYPGWIETDITLGSTINLLDGTATINGSKIIPVNMYPIDCWELPFWMYGYEYTFWYDKTSGLWISMEYTDPYYNRTSELLLVDTNVPIGTTYEHELAAALEVPRFLEPGDSSLLNATVYNLGLSNETNVDLFLLINGTVVNNATIPELVNGTSHTIDYLWTPMVEAMYNVTAYAPPVPDENVTANNIMSKMVYVRYVDVALISDHSELLAITPILDSMGIGYDIYNDNSMYLYTEDLSLLLDYPAVIFYTDYRHITSAEYSALESYLSFGGNLLVTGFDCLVGDYLLADLVRSSSYGDNVGEPDLYVVDATHPIMNGPYRSFPAGYHISGLYSDCDAAEADTARMAVTVAELADGYDKIIATDVLPGKVVFWNGVGPNDWMWNADCEAMFKNTLVWFVIQYEHELAVSLDAPAFLEPGDSSLLNATVFNRGLSNETNVELQLLINGTQVDSVTIPELLNGTSCTISYLWIPMVEAMYNVTAYALPVLGENITINNAATQLVKVRTVKGYVLFDQTHWTDSIFNYNIWVTDLIDRGYIVDTLTTSPITQPMLEGYDVFVIPQAHDYYSSDELSAIQSFVLDGGGLLIIGDDAPYIYTDLTSFAGITWGWESYGWLGYTGDITSHPVTEGVTTAYFSSPMSQMYVSSPAIDLIRDGYGYGEIMLAVSEVGLGAVIGIADENSIMDYYISYGDNQRLANNMIDWLKSRRPVASFTYSPLDPYVGEIVTFDASASYDPDGAIESYIWDFGDDSSGDGNITTHVYAAGGTYTVTLTVVDNENLNSTSTMEITVSRTTLDIEVEVGSIHFRGEIAEFYILVSSLGSPVDADINTTLYYNETPYENLTDNVNRITTGFYRIPYTIPTDASPGTYALVVEANYLSLKGVSLKSFLLSPTLTGWNALLININGTVGTIKTEVGLIEVKLDDINATLVSVEGNLATINSTIGLIQTDMITINAEIASIDGTVATINSTLGSIQKDINAINATIVGIQDDLVTINSTLGQIQVDLDDVNLNLVGIQGDIEEGVATVTGAITDAEGNILYELGQVEVKLDAIDATLTSIEGRLVTIETDIGTIEGNITSIQGDIATIETDIGTIKAMLEGWTGGTTSLIITPEGTFQILVLTTSALEGPIEFSDNIVAITLSGPSGTSGTTNIVIPKQLLVGIESSIDEVVVTVDDEQVVFTYTEQPEAYLLTITYTHSTHTMKIYLAGLPPTPISWVLYVIATAIVVLAVSALLAIYILKIRKPRVAKTK